TPVVAVSANSDLAHRFKALEAGMIAFISKPWEDLRLSIYWKSSGTSLCRNPEHHNYPAGYCFSTLTAGAADSCARRRLIYLRWLRADHARRCNWYRGGVPSRFVRCGFIDVGNWSGNGYPKCLVISYRGILRYAVFGCLVTC